MAQQVAHDADHLAPAACITLQLDATPERAFARPIFFRQALADDGHACRLSAIVRPQPASGDKLELQRVEQPGRHEPPRGPFGTFRERETIALLAETRIAAGRGGE